MARYNQYLQCVIHEMDGANEVGVFQQFLVQANTSENSQRFTMEGTITKSLTNEPQQAVVTFFNPESLNTKDRIVELWLKNYFLIQDEMNKKDLKLSVFGAYINPTTTITGDLLLFSGDVASISIPPTSSITDLRISINAYAGMRARSRKTMKEVFPAETSDLDIANAIIDHFIAEWGGFRGTIVDPEGKLAGKLRKKPFTIDRNEYDALEEICEVHDFVFGNDRNHWWLMPKKHVADTVSGDQKIRDISFQTGKVGLTGIDRGRLIFDHLMDTELQLGRAYKMTDAPSIKDTEYDVRVDSLSYSLSNTSPAPARCEGQWRNGLEAQLPDKKTNDGGGLMM